MRAYAHLVEIFFCRIYFVDNILVALKVVEQECSFGKIRLVFRKKTRLKNLVNYCLVYLVGEQQAVQQAPREFSRQTERGDRVKLLRHNPFKLKLSLLFKPCVWRDIPQNSYLQILRALQGMEITGKI